MRNLIIFLAAVSMMLSFGCLQSKDKMNVNVVNTPPTMGLPPGSNGSSVNSNQDANRTRNNQTQNTKPETQNQTSPPAPPCVDSDNGVNKSVAGVVTVGNVTGRDFCLNPQTITEFSCLNNSIKNITEACGNGQVCREGRCLANPNTTANTSTAPSPNTSACVGPNEPDMFRKESTRSDGVDNPDTCVDYTTVKDFFCQSGKLKSENNQCPPEYGCTGGKCSLMEVHCTDSDDGNNTRTKGRTIVTKGAFFAHTDWDTCKDEGSVIELTCDEYNRSIAGIVPCGNGFKCIGGACGNSKCFDTDGGMNESYQGKLRIEGNYSYTDYCVDEQNLMESSCYGDEPVRRVITCNETSRCLDGECFQRH